MDLLQIEEQSTSITQIVKVNIPTIKPITYTFKTASADIIEVQITPNTVGFLTIKGVSWNFFDIPTYIPL